jgi:peptidoglycan-associated lipoprotein
LTEEEVFARKSVDQLNAERPFDDVFFDLDKSSVREDAKPALQKDAEWMKKWTSVAITLEGHCDSRGSAEYNLGLGNRRAAAVKDYLTSLGVPAGRVTIVSKGKEQPFCNEANEGCWQQNRRGAGWDDTSSSLSSPSCLSSPVQQNPRELVFRHAVFRRLLPIDQQHRNLQAVAGLEVWIR